MTATQTSRPHTPRQKPAVGPIDALARRNAQMIDAMAGMTYLKAPKRLLKAKAVT